MEKLQSPSFDNEIFEETRKGLKEKKESFTKFR